MLIDITPGDNKVTKSGLIRAFRFNVDTDLWNPNMHVSGYIYYKFMYEKPVFLTMVNGKIIELDKDSYNPIPVTIKSKSGFDITMEVIMSIKDYISYNIFGYKQPNDLRFNNRKYRSCKNCNYRKLDPKQIENSYNRSIETIRDEGRLLPKHKCLVTGNYIDENISNNLNDSDKYTQDSATSTLEKGRAYVRKQKIAHVVTANGTYIELNRAIENELMDEWCNAHIYASYKKTNENNWIQSEHKRLKKINKNAVKFNKEFIVFPDQTICKINLQVNKELYEKNS
jgi:hypothetical protein